MFEQAFVIRHYFVFECLAVSRSARHTFYLSLVLQVKGSHVFLGTLLSLVRYIKYTYLYLCVMVKYELILIQSLIILKLQ